MPPKRNKRRPNWESDEDDSSEAESDGQGDASSTASNVEGLPDLVDESDSEGEKNPLDAFVDEMVDLLLARTLNAKQFCKLMHMLTKAGLKGVNKYAKPPGTPSGHYNRHVKRKFGAVFTTDSHYKVPMPGRTKDVIGRDLRDFIVAPVWEQLDEDLRKDPTSLLKLEEAIEDGKLPPVYHSNPVVVAHHDEKPVWPLRFFVDGVPYSQNDGVIGFWLIDGINGKRYFIGGLRKKVICNCGCRGWCTFASVFEFVRYIFETLGEGKCPTNRHDRKPWNQCESKTRDRAGKELLFRGCLVFIKGDWAEYSGTLGFANWGDGVRPCFCCNATLWDLYRFGFISRWFVAVQEQRRG